MAKAKVFLEEDKKSTHPYVVVLRDRSLCESVLGRYKDRLQALQSVIDYQKHVDGLKFSHPSFG